MPLTLRDYAPFITPPGDPAGAMRNLGETFRGIRQDEETKRSALAREENNLARTAEEIRQHDLLDDQRKLQRKLDREKLAQDLKFKKASAIGAAGEMYLDPAQRGFSQRVLEVVGEAEPPGVPAEMQPPGLGGPTQQQRAPRAEERLPPPPGEGPLTPSELLPTPPPPVPSQMAPPGLGMGLPDMAKPLAPAEQPEPTAAAGLAREAIETLSSESFDPHRDEDEEPLEPDVDPVLGGIAPEIKPDGTVAFSDMGTGEVLEKRYKVKFRNQMSQDFGAEYARAIKNQNWELAAQMRFEAGKNDAAQNAVDTVHELLKEAGRDRRAELQRITPGARLEDKNNVLEAGRKLADETYARKGAPIKESRDDSREILEAIKTAKGYEWFSILKRRAKAIDTRLSDFDVKMMKGYQSLWSRFGLGWEEMTEGDLTDEFKDEVRLAVLRDKRKHEKAYEASAVKMLNQAALFDKQGIHVKARSYRDQAVDIHYAGEPWLPGLVPRREGQRLGRQPKGKRDVMKGDVPRLQSLPPATTAQDRKARIEEAVRKATRSVNVGGP